MKKRILGIVLLVLALTAFFLIGTGFQKRNDVALINYLEAEDGSSITLGVQISGSMGYIRGFRNHGGGVKPHYLTFYSTFGGLNNSFGAVNAVVLELDDDDSEIYFNRPGGGYELVLQKNADTGEWMCPNP